MNLQETIKVLPSFEWNIDPVAIQFPAFPLKPVALGGAAVFALSALMAWRKSKREGTEDTSGVSFGIVVAIACLAAAFIWPDAHPSLPLRYYSLIFVLVFLAGYALLSWQIRRGGGAAEDAGDFIVYGVVGVLAGARLGHVLFYDLAKAIDDPIWVFKIWTGGLSSHGATVGLIIAMYLFTKVRGIPFLEGADRFSFSAATGAVLVRIGNFFNSEIVGRETHADWGIRFPRFDCPPMRGAECIAPLRHPTQLYEAGVALVTLLCLFMADRAFGKEKRPRAALISVFFAVYFTGRLGIEFTKEYQVPDLEGTFTMGQYLSLVPAFLGWYGLWWSFKHKLPAAWAPEERTREDEDTEDTEDSEDSDEPVASRRQRLYDPDVEEVFGSSRRRRRADRPRRRKASAPGTTDSGSPADDEEGEERESQAEAAPATDASGEPSERPARRRKKKRRQ